MIRKKCCSNKIKKHYNGNIKRKIFCIWGLSFKPKTDDMREAPSITIIDALIKAGANVQAYDPASLS